MLSLAGGLYVQTLEAGWSAPVAISTSVSDKPDISVDAAGNVVAIWQGFDGNNYVIQSASLPLHGSWSSPVTLSITGNDAQAPEIAHDKAGNVVAVWSLFDGTNSVIQSSHLPFGGSWTSPINISASGGNADSCTIAMDRFGNVGNAIAVWHRYNGSNFIIQGAQLPAGGSWSAAANISASGQDALVPEVDIDNNGNSVITYTRFNGTAFDILSSSQLYSQSWSPNFTLNLAGQTNAQPMVTMEPNTGIAYVVWSEFNGSNYIMTSSILPLGGSWSVATTVSALGEDAFIADEAIPNFSIISRGNLVAIWVRYDGSNYRLQGATYGLLGILGLPVWSTPVYISQAGMDVGNLEICVDASGNALAIWDISDGTNSKIQSSYLPINGSWSTPVDVSTAGQYAYLPEADFDSSGNATAVWLESSGGIYVVKSASLPFGS